MTRNLALALLDDPHGINGVAYGYLTKAMDESEVEWIDIELKVKCCEGRFYLPEQHGIFA